MPLEEPFRRLYGVMQSDIARTRERFGQRVAGHDSVAFDDEEQLLFRSGARLVFRARTEVIATFVPELGLLRWGWAGRPHDGPRARVDAARREARQYRLGELACEQLTVDHERDAVQLVELAAQLIRADGVFRHEDGARVVFLALLDGRGEADRQSVRPLAGPGLASTAPAAPVAPAAQAAWSVAPPPAAPKPALRRQPTGAGRLPPYATIDVLPDDLDLAAAGATAATATAATAHPTPSALPAPIREPTREVFFPVAQVALAAIAQALPDGFHQALFVITLELHDGRVRFFLQLVVSDPNGDLRALEPEKELLEATATMIAADARDGNGRWRRLAARLTPTARGASVDVQVR